MPRCASFVPRSSCSEVLESIERFLVYRVSRVLFPYARVRVRRLYEVAPGAEV